MFRTGIMLIIVCFIAGGSQVALADGHSEYGHPADCSCSSPMVFCEDEYVEGDSTYQDGEEFFGCPLYLSATVNCCCCPSDCTLTMSAQENTVDVGHWSGTVEAALNASLPGGFGVEAGGEVTKGGEETIEVSVGATSYCGTPNSDCKAHDGKVGPGLTTREVITEFDHLCWGVHSGYFDCGDCESSCVSCGHCLDQECTANVTYLSSEIKQDTTCAREMTQGEKDNCGCCPPE